MDWIIILGILVLYIIWNEVTGVMLRRVYQEKFKAAASVLTVHNNEIETLMLGKSDISEEDFDEALKTFNELKNK